MKLVVCLVVILAIFILETSAQRNNRNNRNNRNRNNSNRNNNNNNSNNKKGESKKQAQLLSPPVPEKCSSRPKHFQREGHNYFFSKFEEGFEDLKGDWLEGRNFCREFCMDLVSLETQEENDFFVEFLESSEYDYSGWHLQSPCFRRAWLHLDEWSSVRLPRVRPAWPAASQRQGLVLDRVQQEDCPH